MHINEGYIAGIVPVQPQGTNSTMFTECCEVAIVSTEALCPRCRRKVIGYDEPSPHRRDMIRWKATTRHWKRGH